MVENEDQYQHLPLIKVVGISASGKSTLVRSLRRHGYLTRPVSQEHSNVADLWQQFDVPAVLIYLDADLETQRTRRPDVTWNERWLREEVDRLAHARGHAQLRINTKGQTAEDVARIAITYLDNERIKHADHGLPPLPGTGSATKQTMEEEPSTAMDIEQQPLTRAQRKRIKRDRKREERRAGRGDEVGSEPK